jgi:hypothetical protein
LPVLVKEVAGKQDAKRENQQQTQEQRSSVEFDRLTVRVTITFHIGFLSLDKLHGRDRANEKYGRYAQAVYCQPTDSKNGVGNGFVASSHSSSGELVT